MKTTELVWRSIADHAIRGRRSWSSVADLAHDAAVPPSNAAFALRRLIEVGAVEQRRRGGLSIVNPEKVLTLFAAGRSLERDTVATTTVEGVDSWLATSGSSYAIGGADAAVMYLDGWNNVADRPRRLVYLPVSPDVQDLPPGDEVVVLPLDRSAERAWFDNYSSLAQTYADLFALPGWQAEEFRRALWRRQFSAEDWDQRSSVIDQ